MTIAYTVKNGLYLNITNRCPCSCTFCIRNNGDGAYGSDSLWLEREPTTEEIIEVLNTYDMDKFEEVVFCGYGEPTERMDTVVEVSKHLKGMGCKKIRLNTNGLADLIHGKPTAYMLEGAIDVVSVSLNAGNKEEYLMVTQPSFGECSFNAMLEFASECKKYVKQVQFTIVDVIPKKEIEACKAVSKNLGIELKIRKYDS